MKLRNVLTHPACIIPAATLATGAEAGGALMGAIALDNPVYEVPADACFSPIVKSNVVVDPGADLLWKTQTGIGAHGVVARGIIPTDAYGVVASFKSPDSNDWTEHQSRMLKADSVGVIALKYAEGPGLVEFGARVVAPKGSEACDKAPAITFTPEGPTEYREAIGQLPWPNPANLLYTFTAEEVARLVG